MSDTILIQLRSQQGQCPICKEVSIEMKKVNHSKFGEIKICKKHPYCGDSNDR